MPLHDPDRDDQRETTHSPDRQTFWDVGTAQTIIINKLLDVPIFTAINILIVSIFETPRLQIKEFKESDLEFFIELLSDPEIIEAIPQEKWTVEEIKLMFENSTNYADDPMRNEKVIWGVYEMGQNDLIGLCGFLTNDDNQREIAYRFRTKYWRKGYGTEVTKNMIDYYFEAFELDILAADVTVENIGSVKILEKFFSPVKEFFNAVDKSLDRRYVLTREKWKSG